jgi:hypothetical protein
MLIFCGRKFFWEKRSALLPDKTQSFEPALHAPHVSPRHELSPAFRAKNVLSCILTKFCVFVCAWKRDTNLPWGTGKSSLLPRGLNLHLSAGWVFVLGNPPDHWTRSLITSTLLMNYLQPHRRPLSNYSSFLLYIPYLSSHLAIWLSLPLSGLRARGRVSEGNSILLSILRWLSVDWNILAPSLPLLFFTQAAMHVGWV